MIVEIESEWCETGIDCPDCGCMTYSDGKHRPQCNHCLEYVSYEYIWQWLITEKEEE